MRVVARNRTPAVLMLMLMLLPATASADSLRLADLQRMAWHADPRHERRALDLESNQLSLVRLGNRRLPQITLQGEASTQSDVIEIPIATPSGSAPVPPKDRYAATLRADLLLWDGGRISSQRDLEQASLEADVAELETDLFDVRWTVAELFFRALFLQKRQVETQLMLEDLQSRQQEMQVRVDSGTALPGDASLLAAEVMVVRQQERAFSADRRAALDELGLLTGTTVQDDDVLVAPDLAARVEPLLGSLVDAGSRLPDSLRVHPRFALFDRQRDMVRSHGDQIRATGMPQVSAFGDVSYANPGQRQFPDEFHEEWRLGLHLQWTPWDWSDRTKQIQETDVQARRIDIQEKSFCDLLARRVRSPLHRISQLHAALADDTEIITLREEVEAQLQRQLDERAVPASAYVDARTDLLQARVNRAARVVELNRAYVETLMTLGMEID